MVSQFTMPNSKTQVSATMDDATLQRRRIALLPGHLPASAPAAASHDATPSKPSPPRKTVNTDANNSKPPAAVAVTFVREGAVSDVAATAVPTRSSTRPRQQPVRYADHSSSDTSGKPRVLNNDSVEEDAVHVEPNAPGSLPRNHPYHRATDKFREFLLPLPRSFSCTNVHGLMYHLFFSS